MKTIRDSQHFRQAAIAAIVVVGALATTTAAAPQSHYILEGERVDYKVADPHWIAVQVAKPQAAFGLADAIKDAKWLTGHCGTGSGKPNLVVKPALSDDVALFEVSIPVLLGQAEQNCTLPHLMTLARAITDELGAKAAGLVIYELPGAGRRILTDEIVVTFETELTSLLVPAGDFAAYELQAVDPFLPKRRFVLRLKKGMDPVASLESASRGGNAGGVKVESVTPRIVDAVLTGHAKDFDAWLKEEKKTEDSLTGKIAAAFTGNEAGKGSDSKLSADVSLNKGTFPAELRVETGAQVQIKDEKVQENVTKILINYDYHFRKWLEVYGFTERFTDSFLSIAQRHEIGFGTKLELDATKGHRDDLCCRIVGPPHCARKSIQERHPGAGTRETRVTPKARKMLEIYQESLRWEASSKTGPTLERQKEYCQYKAGIEKRNARLQTGLALSLLADFEQPDKLTVTGTGGGPKPTEPTTVELSPPSSQRYRLTVRPSLRLRPVDRVTLTGAYFWKFALDDPRKVAGERDVREEWNIGLDVALTGTESGGQKVGLGASVTQYHDRVPPRLTEAEALKALPDPDTYQLPLTGLVARQTHTVYKFSLSVSW